MERSKRVKEILAGYQNPDPKKDSPSTSTLNSQSDMETAVDNNQEIYMNDLPPEMLTQILTCMETSRLLQVCRLVSKKWNEISSGILQKRPEKYLWFSFDSKVFMTSDNRFFKDFLDCMRKSKTCPVAHFYFFVIDLKTPEDFFQNQDWFQFLYDFSGSSNEKQNQNQHQNRHKLKSLELNFSSGEDNDNVSFKFNTLIEQLKDLLLNKLPNLEEFGLELEQDIPDSEIGFVPAKTSTATNESMKMTLVPVPVEFQFPKLKTLQLSSSNFSRFPGIIKDLLVGAVNLNKVCLSFGSVALTMDIYNLLCSLGKLELLHNAEIKLDENFLSKFKKSTHGNPNPLQGFKLKEIVINNRFIVNNPNLNPGIRTLATNFLSNFLESNKDTLKSLTLKPGGFLHNAQASHSISLPIFKNLTELELSGFYSMDNNNIPFLLPGIRSMDVFPAVNLLNLSIKNWTDAFPRDNFIPRLPSLRQLSIHETCITEFAISKLALLCPNLKNLNISKGWKESPHLNLLEVGRFIWTEMKQLESLELDVDLDLPQNNSTALDSCFTGMSQEICQDLEEIMEAKRTFVKHEIPVHIQELEIKLMAKAKREHPSILDIKDLRKLTIHPYSGGKLLEKKEFSNKLTWISQEYTFKLMPQLKVNEED